MRLPRRFAPRNDKMDILWQSGLARLDGIAGQALTPLEKGLAVRINPDSHFTAIAKSRAGHIRLKTPILTGKESLFHFVRHKMIKHRILNMKLTLIYPFRRLVWHN